MSYAPSSHAQAQAGPSHAVTGGRRTRRASERTPPPPATAPSAPKHDPHKMLLSEVPKEALGFKAALELHIRILIGAYVTSTVPKSPTVHDIRTFEQRFQSIDLVEQMLRNNARNYVIIDTQIKESLQALWAGCATEHGASNARLISRVPDNIIRLIFGAVHDFGLAAWRPDLLTGMPTSIYNLSLEAIAICTFEQALASWGYRFLKPNVGFINNTVLVKKIYMNFVWSYLRGQVLKEHKDPGSVVRELTNNKAYKGRDELNEKHKQFLINNGFPHHVVQLCSNKECASDHERSPDGSVFFVMHKRARNNHITNFYRWIDSCINSGTSTPLLRGQKVRNLKTAALPRVAHPQGKETTISLRLPATTTLDWFDPDYFNQLDLRFRALYADAPVALPIHNDCPQGVDPRNADWKKMSDEEFIMRYEARVRQQYNFPTPEEIEALDHDADDKGRDDSDDEDPDTPSTANAPPPPAPPASAPVLVPTTTQTTGPSAAPLALPPPSAGPLQPQPPSDNNHDMDEDL